MYHFCQTKRGLDLGAEPPHVTTLPPRMICLASKSVYIVSCEMGKASLLVLKRIFINIIFPTNFGLILDSKGFVN